MSKRDSGDLNKWKFSGLLIHIMVNVGEFTLRAYLMRLSVAKISSRICTSIWGSSLSTESYLLSRELYRLWKSDIPNSDSEQTQLRWSSATKQRSCLKKPLGQVIFTRQSTMDACAVFLNTSRGKDRFFYTVRVTLQRTEGQNITSVQSGLRKMAITVWTLSSTLSYGALVRMVVDHQSRPLTSCTRLFSRSKWPCAEEYSESELWIMLIS
jgi:hypothetical protein